MTELDVLVLGAIFGLFVGFGIRALASWLALRDLKKHPSHNIES